MRSDPGHGRTWIVRVSPRGLGTEAGGCSGLREGPSHGASWEGGSEADSSQDGRPWWLLDPRPESSGRHFLSTGRRCRLALSPRPNKAALLKTNHFLTKSGLIQLCSLILKFLRML